MNKSLSLILGALLVSALGANAADPRGVDRNNGWRFALGDDCRI